MPKPKYGIGAMRENLSMPITMTRSKLGNQEVVFWGKVVLPKIFVFYCRH
jgi:hypothetical protein